MRESFLSINLAMPLAMAILLCAPGPAAGASAAPDAASFCAFDRPSDDGSAILVVWARPADEPNGVRYAVEVASSPEDFASGNFKTKMVDPSPGVRASAEPNYFGHDKSNEDIYFTEISPSAMFPPAEAGDLNPDRLRQCAAEGTISAGELSRALAAQADLRPDKELDSQGLSERTWFRHLQAYIKAADRRNLSKRKSEINAETFYFRLAVVDGDARTYVGRDGQPLIVSAAAEPNIFKWGKLNNLIFSLAFSTVVLAFIAIAKRRKNLFIRHIAGLDAVDEAIGRATEMDQPVFFVQGRGKMEELPTIAAVGILSEVARRSAEHDCRIRVTNIDPIVTAVSQEVVQQAFLQAGRPDAYNADDVSLVASDQFSYVAAVSGSMMRQTPGAIFMMGKFQAESLLLAETGATTGAIQVAGTDSYTQLPFFVTTCDYTLIGEELYAASAYLSRDARVLGSLRGQDVGKVFMMAAIVGGSIILTVAVALGFGAGWLRNLFGTG